MHSEWLNARRYESIWFEAILYIMWCDMIQKKSTYNVILMDVIWHYVVWYDVIWHDASEHNKVWYDRVLYTKLPYSMIRYRINRCKCEYVEIQDSFIWLINEE